MSVGMRKVRGEWPDLFKITGSDSTNFSLQPWWGMSESNLVVDERKQHKITLVSARQAALAQNHQSRTVEEWKKCRLAFFQPSSDWLRWAWVICQWRKYCCHACIVISLYKQDNTGSFCGLPSVWFNNFKWMRCVRPLGQSFSFLGLFPVPAFMWLTIHNDVRV